MRSALIAGLGLLAVIIGGLWIGQGTGLVAGSAMTGQTQWLVIGIIMLIGGVALINYGARPRKRPTPPPDL